MKRKIIISGGGSGGHVFPAIAVAITLKDLLDDVDILFIGAKGRMEMGRVPEAGFSVKGLNIQGFKRDFSFNSIYENIKLPFRFYTSIKQAKEIIVKFNPDVVVGFGGYASAPAVKVAASLKIPTLIQEQNSYPGKTNKLLSKKANIICTAYDGMEKYFPVKKIVKTGNPIRKGILNPVDKNLACEHFGLDPNKKTLIVIGGSLGSRTINESIGSFIAELSKKKIQVIWQTGEYYYKDVLKLHKDIAGVKIMPFVERMDYLYSVADVVVSRAGALAISELCAVAKPCILIPSPNVAEDHQTKNAQALLNLDACVLIKDDETKTLLKNEILTLINDEARCTDMKNNLKKLAQPDAANQIAKEIVNLIRENK